MAILSQGNITTWKCSVNYPLGICYIAIENIPFIVDLPIKNGDFPWFSVCLPEGKWIY
jgi:hypothetical protein